MRKPAHQNIVPFFAMTFLLTSSSFCAGRVGAQELKFANLGALKLESGEDLKDCRLGYRSFGKLNEDGSNSIVMLTWFNRKTKDMASAVGVDKLIDPAQHFVVLIDALGNGVSTSPSNSATQPKNKFPHITMRGMVAAEYFLLTKELQLGHVHAAIGESMGGMQTYQWAASYPSFMDEPIPIIGTPQQSSYDIVAATVRGFLTEK
jgi:homoserine O-acetyltransferase